MYVYKHFIYIHLYIICKYCVYTYPYTEYIFTSVRASLWVLQKPAYVFFHNKLCRNCLAYWCSAVT